MLGRKGCPGVPSAIRLTLARTTVSTAVSRMVALRMARLAALIALVESVMGLRFVTRIVRTVLPTMVPVRLATVAFPRRAVGLAGYGQRTLLWVLLRG